MTFKLESFHLTAAMCDVRYRSGKYSGEYTLTKKEKTKKEMALTFAKELLATSAVNVT